MSSLLSTFTEIAQIDSRTRPGVIAVPLTTEIPYRVFTVKDTYGASESSTITLVTQGADLFENGTNAISLSINFGSISLYAGIPNRWSIVSGTVLNSMHVNFLRVSTLQFQSGSPQTWNLTANAATFGLQNVSTATNVFTVDISSITRFNGPLVASTTTLSSLTLFDRGSLQMKNLQLSSAYLLINGENISSIASGTGTGGGGDLTSGNLTSTVQGLGQTYVSTLIMSTQPLTSTVQGLGQTYVSTLTVSPQSLTSTVQGLGEAYVSTLSLQSTVQGLGQTYVSTLIMSTQPLTSTVQGLGQTYVSTVSLQSTVQGLGLSRVSGTLGINTTAPYTGFTVDINGPTQSAVYYSTMTTGGTLTITPVNFGVFYNITTAGSYTIALSASQPSSNIGKYNVFRNNTTGLLSIVVTGGSGITSPVVCSSLQSITLLVATTNSYALF